MIRWGSSLASGVWILHIFYPDGRLGTFTLSGGKLQIGADAGRCGLVISGQGVAERHCSLTERQGQLILTDNGAPDGTWLNGHRLLQPAELRAGDRLQIGDHLLELTAARPRFDPKMIAVRLQHVPIPWCRSREEVALDIVHGLVGQAGAWNSAGRPRRGLMRGEDTARLLMALRDLGRTPDALDEPLRSWLGHSRRRTSMRRAVMLCVTFLLIATAGVARTIRVAPERPAPSSGGVSAITTGTVVKPAAPQAEIEHVAIGCETLEEVAGLYKVPKWELAEINEPLRPDEVLREGVIVRVPSDEPAVKRWEERRLIEENETWSDLSEQYGIPEAQLRRCNEAITDLLRPGDEVALWVPEVPMDAPKMVFEPPAGGVCVGGVLEAAVQLPEQSEYYARRCPYNAYGTSTTIKHLVEGLTRFHERTRFQGEVVVGDISRMHGGPYGPHKSHRSGRDVDIWLPVRARSYRRGCRSCGTEYCRPDPNEVDWLATWLLIRELAHGGRVERVFLDYTLQAKLHEAAKKRGMSAKELKQWIQWPRAGSPALVQHSNGHTRHMHVRFRPGERDIECSG